jgi:hypothetical protein
MTDTQLGSTDLFGWKELNRICNEAYQTVWNDVVSTSSDSYYDESFIVEDIVDHV